MRRLAAFTACALVLCPGCTVAVTGDGPRREIVSIGITRITVPERKGDVVAFRHAGLGLGLGLGGTARPSAWLGLDRSEWVSADPASCQLLVVVRKDVEAENAARILEPLRGENICYAMDM